MNCQREDGAAMLEFALVATLFLALLYGLITFGVIFALQQSMANAVNEGARAAVAADDAAAATSRATSQAEAALSAFGDLSIDVSAVVASCVDDSVDCITVTATYPYGDQPIIPLLPGFGVAVPDTLNSSSTVQLSY